MSATIINIIIQLIAGLSAEMPQVLGLRTTI